MFLYLALGIPLIKMAKTEAVGDAKRARRDGRAGGNRVRGHDHTVRVKIIIIEWSLQTNLIYYPFWGYFSTWEQRGRKENRV